MNSPKVGVFSLTQYPHYSTSPPLIFSGTIIIQEEAVIGEAEQYWSTTRGVSN